MSLRFKKILAKPLFLILPAYLFSLLLGAKAYAENSYIIVHCLNPEGVEIASIQGMNELLLDGIVQNDVKIYDGDSLIGNGAHNAETHNKPISISSGQHTIKAKFNGLVQEQNITLAPNETKTLTFTFERTEFNLTEWLDSFAIDRKETISGSHRFTHDNLLGVDDRRYYEFPSLDPYNREGFLNVWLSVWPRGYSWDAPDSYGDLIWDAGVYAKFNSRESSVGFNLDLDYVGNAKVELNGETTASITLWEDHPVHATFAQKTTLFNYWLVQSITNGYYPDISVSGRLGGVYRRYWLLGPGWGGANSPPSNRYQLKIVNAGIDYEYFKRVGYAISLPGGGSLRHIQDTFYYREECCSVTEFHAHYSGNKSGTLDEVKMSSVPYDILGTGIKEGGGEISTLNIIDAKTDKSSYTIGEHAKISCNVTDGSGVIVPGAFITAEITKPDNSVETVLISQNELGNYEGIFTDVSSLGTYHVTIKAKKQGFTDASPINLTFVAERNKIPLGKNLPVANQEIEFYSIYIPDRYGGELTVTATGGGRIGLYYPDPYTKVTDAATKIDNCPISKHGWYYVKIIDKGSVSSISNTFVQTGEVPRPWNFWYWPLKKQTDSRLNLYGVNGPLDKYDAIFKDQYNSLSLLWLKALGYTGAKDYEEKNWGGENWDGWEGHCWGGTIASILLPQPTDTIYHIFSDDEIEGIVMKLANTGAKGIDIVTDIPSFRIGPGGKIVPIVPVPGPDETDEFAYYFHKGLIDYLQIGIEGVKKPLQSNVRDPNAIRPDAVWNHAIYQYSSTLEESEDNKEDIIRITTTIRANADIPPPSEDRTVDNKVRDRIETYVYKLKYVDGDLDKDYIDKGQDWISASASGAPDSNVKGFAPRSLRYIKGSLFDGGKTSNAGEWWPYNPYITKENVEKLKVDFPQ